jgi:hypothetical protein
VIRYWIINLMDRQVEAYTDPTGPDVNPGYRQRQDYAVADAVPLGTDGQEVARLPVVEFMPSLGAMRLERTNRCRFVNS